MKMDLRVLRISAGAVLLTAGLWGLFSGKMLTTWAQIAYRPSIIYWITVIALIVLGVANIVVGIRSLFQKK